MKEMSLSEIKVCTLNILDFIDELCQINGIRYFICAGTLLGAVRHNGFIPWDDDIDLMMPRKDFQRLLDLWPRDSCYKFLCADNTLHFPYAYGKVVDVRTAKLESICKKYQVLGCDVDIFPLDNFPDDENEALQYLDEIKKKQILLRRHVAPFVYSLSSLRTFFTNVRYIYYRLREIISGDYADNIVKQFSELAQKYNNQETKYMGITTIYHYGMGERFDKRIFEKVTYLNFERRKYPAPHDYDAFLKNQYGSDYMLLPPENKRISHHSYKVFKK